MSNEITTLKGMTWDHARGFDPMVVTSEVFADQSDQKIRIVWEKRSLQAFADRPIEDMADEYDLMVIDHPHVGDIAATGLLLQLDGQGYDAELQTLEAQSCGVSHPSYNFEGKQWALAIDTATPVSAFRPDMLEHAPQKWDDVVALAEANKVIWPLIPINALMSYFNVLANIGSDFGKEDIGVDPKVGANALTELRRVSLHLPRESFDLDPIGAYEWLSCRNSYSYCPYLYGYTNYSRKGFRPNHVRVANIPAFGENGPVGSPIGGTGIAISARTKHKDIALQYAFWIASEECQSGTFFQAGGQPANVRSWLNEECNQQTDNFFLNTLETLEKSYLRPRHKGYMGFQDVAGDVVRDCLMGKVAEADAAAKVNDLYQRSFR
jgi:multiple sugar transport system substrate-binding protein